MPDPKDDPKSSEWRPYIFARDQWHCRICGERFLYSEMVRKHIANEHNETMPPSMYEYLHGAVWRRKKLPDWAVGDFDTLTGPVKGANATVEVLLPIAAVAVGMTVLGLVFHIIAGGAA